MATVLITGTSKGIGLETALAFARAGYKVAAAMRNPAAAPELANTASKENLDITIYKIDVDSDASVNDGVDRINKEMGPIDVLVNNAGIERMGTVEELKLDDFRAVMETNYFGVIRCVQAVLSGMRKRGSGCIINIASVAGRIASPAMSAYSATKFALESLSEILAQEVKSFGIRVAIVEPGIINTSMAQHITVKPEASDYSHAGRLSALFTASLKNPVPPTIVADKILEIVQSETDQLRHPVGPDAMPFLGWRQSMSDEEWVALGALEDDAWYARVKADFTREFRPHEQHA
jgi:NAD(P)-dependent dehydrogenase (short-subunit alcohol dehydrogenase family)